MSTGDLVDVWSAQCGECFKWRIIPTLEEYEEIRSKFIEDPFVCSKKPGYSCDQPADLEYNKSRTWVIDKPNLPKTPPGFTRTLVMRKDKSKFDCYYDLIDRKGKRFRSGTEITKFLDENPQYKKDMSPSDFCFTSPKVMADTIPVAIDKPNRRNLMPQKDDSRFDCYNDSIEGKGKSPRSRTETVKFSDENPEYKDISPSDSCFSSLGTIPMLVNKSDIPKNPIGFRRRLVQRKDNSRFDIYYDLIEGTVYGKRTFRSKVEIARFFDENPELKRDGLLSDFCFSSPKITGDTNT